MTIGEHWRLEQNALNYGYSILLKPFNGAYLNPQTVTVCSHYALGLVFWQVEPQVQFAQLGVCGLCGRAKE